MTLQLHNTLTRRKEEFKPIDVNNIRMYVCGPTVYDRPHLGNARSVVVYDVLYRLLQHLYPRVTYVRNITDVDDKINAAAKANNEPISALTKRVEGWFHEDMAALNCLPPTEEPHATGHIKQMIALIEKLIAGGHAYVAQNHVLFAVASYKDYGALSGRKLDELVAGARVEVEAYKKHPGDFVLWKPADAGDDASSVFDSPWGRGRPGWHIECSAMSTQYLGQDFDIHGGGADLMFPHHENEIAQSRCALPHSHFANYWVHNGFLTVNGEKMSKSLGNFVTVKDLLDKGVKGEVIRYALLKTKYNEPLDWTEKLLSDAKKELDTFYRRIDKSKGQVNAEEDAILDMVKNVLCDDLNIPVALSILHSNQGYALKEPGKILGILQQDPTRWFKEAPSYGGIASSEGFGAHRITIEPSKEEIKALVNPNIPPISLPGVTVAFREEDIENLINSRIAAKKAKNFAEADRIRKELANQGIILEDRPNGTTDWRRA